MKKLLLLSVMVLSAGCQKKPEPPVPVDVAGPTNPPTQPNPPPTTPPPPVTNCQGGTVAFSSVSTIADNSIKDVVIPGFDLGCGDTVQVFFRNQGVAPTTAWTEIHDVPNGASYFALDGQIIHIHNSGGSLLDLDVEALLK